MKVQLITSTKIIYQNIIDAIEGARLAFNTQSNYSKILSEENYQLGLKLSNSPVSSGHDKFLQSIHFLIDITMPRYFFSEFDTYRIGISKQSESTMHTLLKTNLSINNFELDDNCDLYAIIWNNIYFINEIKEDKTLSNLEKLRIIKQVLPESFLQTRRISMNYAVVKLIYSQRKNHKLKEWKIFLDYLKTELPYSEFAFGKEPVRTINIIPQNHLFDKNTRTGRAE